MLTKLHLCNMYFELVNVVVLLLDTYAMSQQHGKSSVFHIPVPFRCHFEILREKKTLEGEGTG